MKEIINQYITSPISKFISDFLEVITNAILNNIFYVPNDMLSIAGMAQKYNVVKRASRTFIIISLLVCIISLLYSLDVFSTAKLRKSINDFFIALFFVSYGAFFINKSNELANIFTKMWFPQGIDGSGGLAGAIIMSIGLAGGPVVLQTMGMILLILAAAVIILLLLMILTHNIAIGLMQVCVIIFPLAISVYPMAFGKSISKAVIGIYCGLLILSPLQALVINLLVDSIGKNSNPTFSSLMAALSMLILTVLVVPGVIIYVIARASNPSVR